MRLCKYIYIYIYLQSHLTLPFLISHYSEIFHSTRYSHDTRFRKILSCHNEWDENMKNIAEKETGTAGCRINVNCPIKSSYMPGKNMSLTWP